MHTQAGAPEQCLHILTGALSPHPLLHSLSFFSHGFSLNPLFSPCTKAFLCPPLVTLLINLAVDWAQKFQALIAFSSLCTNPKLNTSLCTCFLSAAAFRECLMRCDITCLQLYLALNCGLIMSVMAIRTPPPEKKRNVCKQ